MSANTVILTSRNQNLNVPNQYVYQFPSTQNFKDHEIALTQFSIYNSFFNIETSRNNNALTVTWNALAITTHQLTFQSGFYSISDINYAIQQFCILNNLYMLDTLNNKNVYFIELLSNSISYAGQLNFYPIPTSNEATNNGWTQPNGATWNFPNTATTPQISVSNDFGILLGFNAQTYPITPLNANQQYLSNFSPTISPISSIFLNCNLISSPYSNPSNLLGNTAITSSFGDLIQMKNNTPIYLSIVSASYNQIEINLLDQNFTKLEVRDKEIVIVLVIKEKFKQ